MDYFLTVIFSFLGLAATHVFVFATDQFENPNKNGARSSRGLAIMIQVLRVVLGEPAIVLVDIAIKRILKHLVKGEGHSKPEGWFYAVSTTLIIYIFWFIYQFHRWGFHSPNKYIQDVKLKVWVAKFGLGMTPMFWPLLYYSETKRPEFLLVMCNVFSWVLVIVYHFYSDDLFFDDHAADLHAYEAMSDHAHESRDNLILADILEEHEEEDVLQLGDRKGYPERETKGMGGRRESFQEMVMKKRSFG